LRSTICLSTGIMLVLMRQPLVGIIMQAFGLMNMFGPFLPTILTFLRLVPVVGQLLKLPPVALVLDALVGSSKGSEEGNDLVLGGLFVLALSSVVYSFVFPPAPVTQSVASASTSSDDDAGSSLLLYVLLLILVTGFGSFCAAYYYGWLDNISEMLKTPSTPDDGAKSAEASEDSVQDVGVTASMDEEDLPPDATVEAAGEDDESKESQNNAEAMDFLKSVPLVGSFFSLSGVSAVVGGKSESAGGERERAAGGGDGDDGGNDDKERKASLIKTKLDQLSSRREKMAEGSSASDATTKKMEWPSSLTVEQVAEDMERLQEDGDDGNDAATAATIDAEGLRTLSTVLTQGGGSSNTSKYAAEMLPAYHCLQSSEARVGGMVGLMAVMQAQLLAGVLAAQVGDSEEGGATGSVGKLQQKMLTMMQGAEEGQQKQAKAGKAKQAKQTKGKGKGKAKGKAKVGAKGTAGGAVGSSVEGARGQLATLHRTLNKIAVGTDASTQEFSAALAWAGRAEGEPQAATDELASMSAVRERVSGCDSQDEYLQALQESFHTSTASTSTGEAAVLSGAPAGAPAGTTGAHGGGRLSVPVFWLDQVAQRETNEGRVAVDTYQDGKDIARDRVQINGTLYKGSEHGYDGILRALTAAVECTLHDSLGLDSDRMQLGAGARGWGRDTAVVGGANVLRLGVGTGELIAFARRVLSACNRTHSGGLSYEALEGLVRHPDLSLLVPDSMQATPLSIQIDAGPFQPPDLPAAASAAASAAAGQNDSWGVGGEDNTAAAGSGWRWGVRATVTTSIPYKLTDASACVELGAVNATFMTRIALDVGVGVEGNAETAQQADWNSTLSSSGGCGAPGLAVRQTDAEAEAYCDHAVELWEGEVAISLQLFEQG
jgi:hypothetical protein